MPERWAKTLHKHFNATLEHMTIDEIIDFVDGLDGVLTRRPVRGDGSPEVSRGDVFFFHAPDGEAPETAQPFATIVTKDYPGDEASRLDRPDAFRVNVAAGREEFIRWTGHAPREAPPTAEPSAFDTVMAHPVYGALGWLAVVNPGPRTDEATRDLLRTAHRRARSRHERRVEQTSSGQRAAMSGGEGDLGAKADGDGGHGSGDEDGGDRG